jgi:hypothetical protein
MTTALAHSSQVWNSDLGEFVSDAHVHLAQVLNDYKPTFSLVYIPKADRDADDTKPWAILDSPANMPAHIIRYLSDQEMQRPAEVLAWIFEGDLDKHRPDDVFARMELKRQAEELMNLKKQEEELADHYELIEFAARTNKNTWKHNGRTYRA